MWLRIISAVDRIAREIIAKKEDEQCCQVIELNPKGPEELIERIKSCQQNDEMCMKLLEDKPLLTSSKLKGENGLLYQGSRILHIYRNRPMEMIPFLSLLTN